MMFTANQEIPRQSLTSIEKEGTNELNGTTSHKNKDMVETERVRETEQVMIIFILYHKNTIISNGLAIQPRQLKILCVFKSVLLNTTLTHHIKIILGLSSLPKESPLFVIFDPIFI